MMPPCQMGRSRPVLLATGRPWAVFYIGVGKEVLFFALLFYAYFRPNMLAQPAILIAVAVAIPMLLSVVVGLQQHTAVLGTNR